MLEDKDKEELGKHIDKLINEISCNIKKNTSENISNKQKIDRLIKITVNTFTPESKMILSSLYSIMKNHTLAEPIYNNSVTNKAAFYEMNIMNELNNKFNFDVPKNISYEEYESELNRWIEMGAVVVAGGTISITLGNIIPISVSAIVVGILFASLKNDKAKHEKEFNEIIDNYLKNIKTSMMSWIDSISKYYDEKIKDLEGKLV